MFRLRSSAALALVFALSTAGSAAAQDAAVGPRVASNTFFVELGGNAVAYSLNYERFFTPRIGIRIGGMYLQGEADDGSRAAVGLFPVMATYLLGVGNSHFETGAGIGFATAGVSDSDFGDDDWGDSAVYGTCRYSTYSSGRGSSCKPQWRTSPATPTIVIQSGSVPSGADSIPRARTRRPMGLWPGKNCSAMVLFMMPTRGVP